MWWHINYNEKNILNQLEMYIISKELISLINKQLWWEEPVANATVAFSTYDNFKRQLYQDLHNNIEFNTHSIPYSVINLLVLISIHI